MLTKEQIGLICGVKVGADLYLTEEMIAEVRRLAMLGLEAEKRTLKPETAYDIRILVGLMHSNGCEDCRACSALADLSRCYPEEV